MIKILSITLLGLLLSNCKQENKKIVNDEIKEYKVSEHKQIAVANYCKSLDTLTFQNDTLTVRSEFVMRGDGVITLDISDKLIIYNQDDSVFGEIAMIGESVYDINLPKTIIARQFIPMFDQFVFDANKPKENNDYLEIFINKELKKIKKNIVSYQYETWNNYVKKSFINIRNCNGSRESNIDKNTYEVMSMNKDYMNVKSVAKNSCDQIENYTNAKKYIKWKDKNTLLVSFYECN